MESPSGDCQRSDVIQEVRCEKPVANGGLVAWLGVLGAWLMFFITWGPAGSFGVFEAYYKSGMLSSYSESTIAWIDQYQFYNKEAYCSWNNNNGRGIVFPILFNALEPKVGFSWTIRVFGFLQLVFGLAALGLLLQMPQKSTKPRRLFEWRAFTEIPYTTFCVGCFCQYLSYWIPLFYLVTYGRSVLGMSDAMSSYLLSILHGSSAVGRILPNLLMPKFGAMPVVFTSTVMCAVLLFAWIGIRQSAGIIVFCVLFGISSGTFVAANPVATLHPTITPSLTIAGERLGMNWLISGLGTLVGAPIAGTLSRPESGQFLHAQIFTGCIMVGAALFILQVSAISLGSWLTYGDHVDKDRAFACMKAAYDCGINFFDSAEGYANGNGERIIGECIRKFGWKRNDLVISTKESKPPDKLQINWGGSYGELAANNYGLSRKHIIEGLDASLERMGLSYVDLVYAHRPDRKTPIEETVRAFNHIINMGKAFYWGTSQWSADEIATAWRYADKLGLIGPTMEQPEYNMLMRTKVESEFLHLYREVGTGLTVFSPLSMGLLTGKYNDGIPDDSRLGVSEDKFVKLTKSGFGNEEGKKMLEKIARLKPIAESLGTSQAILALAWVLKNKNVSSAITGASRPEQILESVKVFSILPKLTDDIMEDIDNILGNRPTPFTSRFM
ncbi:putative potassium channel beta subunit [Fusarium sporotrichioides]|uniref:Putative potassium channel beta subunit n=1 Tax=Fusarium sporotrichioides TaxID=5514 RepID=A0A395SCC7_FUSSP|nr:putative potassium channel beta subunit [Fusarium sporotrichioides]